MNFRKIKLSILSILLLLAQSLVFSHSVSSNYKEKLNALLDEDEKFFINSHRELDAVCDPLWAPFEYKYENSYSNEYSGINVHLLKNAAEVLGININIISTQNYKESMEKVHNSTASIISGYTDLLSSYSGIKYSIPLYDVSMVLLSKTGSLPKEGETILLPQLSEEHLKLFKNQYPDDKYNLLNMTSPQDTLKEFAKNKYKYALVNEFELAEASKICNYIVIPIGLEYSMRFGFSPDMEDQIISAFNKAFEVISPEFESIVLECQFERKSFTDALKAQAKNQQITVTALIISAILLLVIISLLFMLFLKKHKTQVEYDDLTSLYSTKYFKHLVKEKLKKAKPNEYMILAVDINNFNYINDSFTNEIGNALLIELARHFDDICRSQSDAFCCRPASDNFIFFFKNPGDISNIEDFVCFKLTNVSDHVRKILPENYKLEFSSGVYYIVNLSEPVNTMMDKANQARKKGKEIYSTPRTYEYTIEMEHDIKMKRDIIFSMKSALENGEFEVYYQPKFRFTDEIIMGAEALIRWNSPKKGFLSPAQFVPLFEQNGFIKEIDFFVFEKVCKFLEEWNHCGKDGTCPQPLTISFNLSRRHLEDNDLVQTLKNIVSKYEIKPSHIEVELTESIVFDNPQKLVSTMNKIKQAGFSISVDDFGAGYSSLNLLKDLPADVIKLDKEFLSSAENTERKNVIINSVIDMAKKLHLTTVAEGVETESQSAMLKKMGCDIVQGFLYARPMQESQYKKLLKEAFIS